jgi:hypothetical protein
MDKGGVFAFAHGGAHGLEPAPRPSARKRGVTTKLKFERKPTGAV